MQWDWRAAALSGWSISQERNLAVGALFLTLRIEDYRSPMKFKPVKPPAMGEVSERKGSTSALFAMKGCRNDIFVDALWWCGLAGQGEKVQLLDYADLQIPAAAFLSQKNKGEQGSCISPELSDSFEKCRPAALGVASCNPLITFKLIITKNQFKFKPWPTLPSKSSLPIPKSQSPLIYKPTLTISTKSSSASSSILNSRRSQKK